MADSQSYADSSGFVSPNSPAARRRLFEAMMSQGPRGPVGHWAEGVSRVARAMIGGYGAYQAEEDERKSFNDLGDILGGTLGGSAAPANAAAAAPVVAPPALPPPAAPTASAPAGEYPGVRPGTPFTDRWRGFLDDLRGSGVAVDPTQSGGYANRNIRGTNVPSLHASDQAYDVNWRANPEGAMDPMAEMTPYETDIEAPTRIPPQLARELAQRHGMRWGGDFTGRSPDPMHFEVAGGVPMAQRSITARAGAMPPPMRLGGPSISDTGDVSGAAPPAPPAIDFRGAGLPELAPNATLPPQPPAAPISQRPPAAGMPPTLIQEAQSAPPAGATSAGGLGPPGSLPPVSGPMPQPTGVPGMSSAGPMPPPAPAGPQAAPPPAAPAVPQTMPANDVIRRLLTSRNPQAIQFGMQLYRDTMRRGPTADYDFLAVEGSLYRINKRTGQAEVVAGGGQGKPPAGYRWAGNGQLAPIPGGPAEALGGETAGRLASMQTARQSYNQAQQFLTNDLGMGDAIGSSVPFFGAALAPQYDMARRTVRLAIEGALRANTGAAAPQNEVDQYMDAFMPRATDPKPVRQQKLTLLRSFMDNIEANVMRGHGGAQQPQQGGADSFSIRRLP